MNLKTTRKDLEITFKNQIARLKNEINIYRTENQQLQQQYSQLEKDKQNGMGNHNSLSNRSHFYLINRNFAIKFQTIEKNLTNFIF